MNCFYLQAIDIDASVQLVNSNGNTPDIKYSKNGEDWYQWDYSTLGIDAGEKMYFKGNNGFNFSKYGDDYTELKSKFSQVSGGKVVAGGNIMSLLDDGECTSTKVEAICFFELFKGFSNLDIDDSFELPATTLDEQCYHSMFYDCTSLTQAPELPATGLSRLCYGAMFQNCTSLTTAPELPATTLAYGCYDFMFWGCTSLTTAPELPATTLAEFCYNQMFQDCISLNSVTCLAEDISAYFSTNAWLKNVSQTGTFYAKYGVNYTRDKNGIPEGWNVVYLSTPLTIKYSLDGNDWQDELSITIPALGGSKDVYIYVNGSTDLDTLSAFCDNDRFTVTDRGGTYSSTGRIETYRISAGENQGFETIEAEVEFYAADGSATVTGSIDVTQELVLFTIPVWKDIYFTDATDTLDYEIMCEGEVIYRGRAYVQPNKHNVSINISKIVQDYLSNKIEDGNYILTDDGFILGNFEAIKNISVVNLDGDVLAEYTYRYDWSYEDTNINSGVITKPINGHRDQRMIPISTSIQESESYITEENFGIYPTLTCGDYALYYLQRNGGYAAFLIEGNAKKTDSYERYTYNMAFNNTKAEFEESIYHNQIKTSWELHTGWLTDVQADNFAFNLLSSNRVFLHNLKTNKISPVIIDNSSAEYKTFKNNGRKMVNYTINLTESQNKQYL